MAMLSGRLRRYSEKCVSDRFDEDFAKAVQESADIIEKIEYPETNADRIRSMTDSELAKWMCTEYRKIPWCRSDNEEDIESGKCRPQVCVICANVWLKEEVKDDIQQI